MAGINLVNQLKNAGREEVIPETGGGGNFKVPKLNFEEFTNEDKLRAVIFVVGIGLIFGTKFLVADYTGRLLAEKTAVDQALTTQITETKQKLATLKDISDEADRYDARLKDLQQKYDMVEAVSRNRNLLVRMVDFVVSEMPNSLWLNRLNIDLGTDRKVEVVGNATTLQLVGEFMKRLEGAVFFPSWQLVETENQPASAANANAGSPKAKLVAPPDSKKFTIEAKVATP